MEESLILSIGADGRFASLVVPELVRRGAHVRGFVHKAEKADVAKAKGASEVAFGDLSDPASLDTALKGVAGVFYIAPAFAHQESQLGLNIVAAAQRACVRRFVFSSVIHPTLELENHRAKVPVEAAVYTSGMEFVVLHPAVFFENLESGWPSVLERGVIAQPYSKKARLSYVDYRDVAEVAAIALTEDRLTYGTFELCAVGLFSREDIARMMSEALGRKIEAGEPSFEDWAAKAQLPYDERQKQMLQRMFEHYDKHGIRGNSETLRAILGREPRTLRQFIGELAANSRAAA
jgi:uncharacterized protein YbjT (DUF2867 family)